MDITAPRFTDETAAREHLEALRWPQGPVCPHCGSFDATRMAGAKHRVGAIQCNDCRQQFSVTVGTVFERSKIKLHKWVLATFLLTSSKKGMSAHQLHRMLGVTYKTAWFMAHRIREAMMPTNTPPMGEDGGMVEADETYIGRRKGMDARPKGGHHKMQVLTLVERNTGRSRSFHIDKADVKTLALKLDENVSRAAHLMTDEWQPYKSLGWNFAAHSTVTHRNAEYVRKGAPLIHTNTVEGFYSIFKRGMKGIYQHCGEQHLGRYVAEFDFRYTNRIANGVNDNDRANLALKGIEGKRLTYRRVNGQRAA